MNVRRISYLEGIRGFCCIAVFNSHISNMLFPWVGEYQWIRILKYTPLFCIDSAGMAVSYFFFLSGFASMLSDFEKPSFQLMMSCVKRYFRLFPVIMMCDVVSYIVMRINHLYIIPGIALGERIYSYSQYDIKLSFGRVIRDSMWDTFTTGSSFVSTFWTIRHQFWGILLIYIILLSERLFKKGYLKIIVFGIIGNGLISVFSKALSYLVCMEAGFLYFILYNYIKKNAAFQKIVYIYKNVIMIICIIVLEIISVYTHIKLLNEKVDYTFLCWIPCVCILLYLSQTGESIIKKFFENKVMVTMGEYSFAIYGIHTIIICSIGCYLMRRMIVYNKIYCIFVYMICLIITIICSIIISKINRLIQRNIVDKMFYEYFARDNKQEKGVD